MAKVVNAHEALAQLSRLLAKGEAGEEVIITRDGEAVARLIGVKGAGKRPLGFDKGLVTVSDDFDAPLPGWR
jgi:prevent-host-death family protein